VRDLLRHLLRGAAAVEHHPGVRLLRGLLEEPVEHPPVEVVPRGLDPVPGRADPCPGDLLGHGEQDGQVGPQAARRPPRDRPDHVGVQQPPVALVGDRRADVAVAHVVAPGPQRRLDALRDGLGPVGGHEQRLRPVVQPSGPLRQQHLAQVRTELGAARFVGERGAEPLREQRRLRGLAGALAALEHDEPPAGHGGSPSRRSSPAPSEPGSPSGSPPGASPPDSTIASISEVGCFALAPLPLAAAIASRSPSRSPTCIERPARNAATTMISAASHKVMRTPGTASSKPNSDMDGTSSSAAPVAARASPLKIVARNGPRSSASSTQSRTTVSSVAKMRPRSSSPVCSCSSVNPSTYTAPAHRPRKRTPSAASQKLDMDAATNRPTPAPNTSPTKTCSLGRRRWNTDSSTTPTATPMPSAVMKRAKVLGLPMTNRAKVGPSGTSIAPPMMPVASPMFTPRTTGLTKMNSHPSRISSQVRRSRERSSS